MMGDRAASAVDAIAAIEAERQLFVRTLGEIASGELNQDQAAKLALTTLKVVTASGSSL